MIFPPQIKSSVVFRWFKTVEGNLVCEVYDRDDSANWLFSFSTHNSELEELSALPEDDGNTSRFFDGATWADYEAFMTTGELPYEPNHP